MSALTSTLILATAFVLVFLQSALGGVRFLFGAQPDLLPALMVYVALSRTLRTITTLAIGGGLFMDSLSANPLGSSVLPLLVVGLLLHARRDLILRDQVYAQWVLGLAACGLNPLLTLLVIQSTGATPLIGWGFVWQWLVLTVSGACFVPLFFILFDRVHRAFSYQTLPETSFRADRQIKRGRA
jgi:rod shape-determining protein MreD